MSIDYLLPCLELFCTFKQGHSLWGAFQTRIMQFDTLTAEEVYKILKLSNQGQRVKTPVWAHLQEKFLIGKGLYLQMDLLELQEIESWYKESGREYSKELKEMMATLRARKSTKNVFGQLPTTAVTDVGVKAKSA